MMGHKICFNGEMWLICRALLYTANVRMVMIGCVQRNLITRLKGFGPPDRFKTLNCQLHRPAINRDSKGPGLKRVWCWLGEKGSGGGGVEGWREQLVVVACVQYLCLSSPMKYFNLVQHKHLTKFYSNQNKGYLLLTHYSAYQK